LSQTQAIYTYYQAGCKIESNLSPIPWNPLITGLPKSVLCIQ